MDDETAEIELLEQNLNKTRQISQRMISILSSFDTRLVKVENSIRPLYSSSQILHRRGNNIEAALQKIDEVKSNQEGIAAEEALILRGPQPGQLDAYKDVLERLNTSIAFKSLDRDLGDTARLVETGAKKLTQLYTKLVAEGSSGVPLNGPEFVPSPFPTSVKQSLLPVVSLLRSLPLPATHPSHPAAPGIQATFKEAQKGYADMRGSWIRKCLENYGRRVVDRAETIDGVASGRELGAWVENLLNVAELEYELLVELAPLPTQTILPNTYSTLINPLLALFSTTLSSLGSLIKRSLHKNTFLALSVYGNLSSLQSRWDDLMCRRPGRKENELKDSLHSIRASCLRAFPELLADIKAAALSTRSETNVGLADFSLSTVQFLERIPEVQMAVASALITLGDGNWKMGEGVKAVGSKITDIDEQTILEHYVYDVVTALLATLNTVSRSNKRPAFGAIFLLNNVSYLNTYLVDQPRPEVAALLSKPTKDALTSNFRIAKAGYFDTNFSPLMSALQEDKDKSKSATKERFTRFYDLLEEVAERHRLAKVLHDDRAGRDTVCEEVVKLVVPSLQRFTQRNTGKEFSKNPQKYIKMSSEEVESLIRSFYSDTGAKRTSIADRTQANLLAQAGWTR